MFRIQAILTKLNRDDSGVAALEYGLIAALVAVVIISAVSNLGTNLTATYQGIANHFNGGDVSL